MCDFHTKQAAELVKLSANIPEPHGAVVCRSLRIPIGEELANAEFEAVAAVGISDFEDRAWDRQLP